MCGLLVENLLARGGRADHVPVVPAQAYLVHLAILAGPGGDLLVWLAAELVGVSKDGETRRPWGSFGAGWWSVFHACVYD